MTISDEVLNSIKTTALNAANSSQLTWESTNKSSWTDYVATNSSDGELNSTATYQTETEWLHAHSMSYDDSFNTAYVITYNDVVGDS